jgi:RimJ/RimL family protein N-acetyltransferase
MHNKKEIINLFPLIGNDVELSLFCESDIIEPYIGWLNDSTVVKYSNQRFRVHTVDSSLQYFQSMKQADAIFIGIKDRQTKALIGTMTAYFNRPHQTADMGIMLGNKDSWGKGIGQQAWGLLLNFLLTQAVVRKVTGGALSCNHGMVSIMKKTGMVPDGIRLSQELVEGQLQDIVHFAAFRGGNGY